MLRKFLLHVPGDRAAQRALILVAGLTALVGALLVVGLWTLRQQTLDFARHQTQSLTLAVSEQAVRTLQTVEQALHSVEPVITHAPRLDLQGLATPVRALPYVKALWWLDAHGALAFDSEPAESATHARAFNTSHPQWESVRSAPSHATHWLAPRWAAADGVWYLLAVHPVYDRDQTYHGMLIAAMDPEALRTVWRAVDLGDAGSITLMHRSGVGMLREPTVPSTFGKNFASRPLFRDFLPERSEGWYIDQSAADGIERLYQYRVPPSHPDLVVLVGQSTQRLLDGWWKTAVAGMLAWLAPALVVATMAGQLVQQWELNRTAQDLMCEQSRELRELSQRILQAQEAERARIARELHDELGQSLTALKINLQSAQRFPAHDTAQALQDNLRIVDDTIGQVRALALALRPSILDNLGLRAALQWMGQQVAQRAGFDFSLQPGDAEVRLSEPLETCCFRIAQEALTNIARHAHARHAWITLRHEGTELVMQVQDDGVGMNLAVQNHNAPTLGLAGMRERAALVQGTLGIESKPGQGCTITLRCPLRAA